MQIPTIIQKLQLIKNLIFKNIKIGKHPYNIQVDVTVYCNLTCKMCSSSKINLNYNNKVMSFEIFKKAIDTFKPKTMNFCPIGEPYMNPDLLKMIHYLSENNIYSILTTNGTLVLKNHTPKELISSGLKFMRFSIDAATCSTYKKIRGIDTFDTIVDNIKSIINAKVLYKAINPSIRLDFVVQNDNINEMVNILHLAHEIGVNDVHYRLLRVDLLSKERQEMVSIKLDREKIIKICSDVKKTAKKYKIRTDINRYKKLYFTRKIIPANARFVCILPWVQLFCDIDGNIMPCAVMKYNPDKKGIVGNILERSTKDLWNGEEMHKIRKDFKSKKNYQIYHCCKNCPIAFSLQDLIEIALNLDILKRNRGY